MKTKFHFAIALVASVCFAVQSQAQEDSVKKSETSFKLGVYYNSGLNYYGRTDSLRSSAVFPVAELWFNKKFYMNAAPVFVNNSTGSFQYAGAVATAGYQARSENEKWFTHIFLTKPFYESSSQLVQSALKAQFNTNLTWLNKIINLNAGADVKLSDKLDYGLNAGLDHIFRAKLKEGFSLVLDPSAYVYAGTQQFTRTYYKNNNLPILPGNAQQVTEEVSKLNILSYEVSMPVVLTKNKWQVILNPAYVIPQNLIQVEGRPELSERGKEMFYITAGIKYNF